MYSRKRTLTRMTHFGARMFRLDRRLHKRFRKDNALAVNRLRGVYVELVKIPVSSKRQRVKPTRAWFGYHSKTPLSRLRAKLRRPALALDVDVEPFDLLVERGERDVELFGGFGLAPVGGFEGFDDFAPLEIGHDLE